MEKGRSCPLPSPPLPLNPFSFQPLLGGFSQGLRHPCCPSLDFSVSHELPKHHDRSREGQQLGTASGRRVGNANTGSVQARACQALSATGQS